MAYLILTGGRIIDPANSRDEIADIAFKDGKVAEIGRSCRARAPKSSSVAGKIVTPGLIDLHTHVYWGGTSLGVDAGQVARTSGTTTFVDAGSSGPGNFHGFRRHVIEPSPVRILPILNVSHAGIFAFSTTVMVGECADLRLLDPRDCVRVVNANRDLIVGVKVRVGRTAGGNSGIAPLDMAIEVAEEVGLPVMAHLDHPPPSRLEVLSRLRRGDILTHCFRPFPNAPVAPTGGARGGRRGARARHRLRYRPWRRLVRLPHRRGHAGGWLPARRDQQRHPRAEHQRPGLRSDHDDVEAVVARHGFDRGDPRRHRAPAAAVGRADLGHLGVGAVGDASIIDLAEGAFDYRDVLGETRHGVSGSAQALLGAGKWWHRGLDVVIPAKAGIQGDLCGVCPGPPPARG
jgi:dihydroorotase